MSNFTKAQITAFIQDHQRETGEKLSRSAAVALMDVQEQHANEADAGEPGSGLHVPSDAESKELLQGEAPAPEVPAPEAPKAAAGTKVLKVKTGLKYRGARQAWYERLVAHDGQPLEAYVKSVTENRPSTYGARSKHSGSPEPVRGWVRFFERTGVFQVVDSAK